MNKKILAPIACIMAVAMFSACGSQDVPDDTPVWPDYSGYIKGLDNAANNDSSNAGLLGTGLFNGPINFVGSLDNVLRPGKDETVLVLDEDWYKLQLRRADVISITVSQNIRSTPYAIPYAFRFRFKGECNRTETPTSRCIDKVIDVKNITSSYQDTISIGHIPPGGNIDASGNFYIRIFGSENSYPSSIPYAVSVKLVSREPI